MVDLAETTTSAEGREAGKRAAAVEAVRLVSDGMLIGLGTGSTAAHFVDLLADRMRTENLRLLGVPTSLATAAQAGALGIPLTTLDDIERLDLTVDGADEAARNPSGGFDLIKGGGGAHLREKIVAAASARLIVIADDTKLVPALGAVPLPVEIIPFGAEATRAHIAAALESADVEAREITRRQGNHGDYVTDEGNGILDLHLGRIGDPAALATTLSDIPGVVEHGLFIGMAERLILGRANGTAETVLPTD
ncbi:MAG: ribose-5-phosphate isomerase RpiA [Pseudomonadota bacterium]